VQPVRVVTHICNYSYLFFSKDPFSSKTCNGNGKGNGNRGEGKSQGIFLHVFTFFCISVGSSDTLFVSLWNDFLEEERNNGTQKSKKKEMKRRKNRRHQSAIFSLFIEYHIVIYTAVQCMYIVRDCVGHC
jgi:hypothetical protein